MPRASPGSREDNGKISGGPTGPRPGSGLMVLARPARPESSFTLSWPGLRDSGAGDSFQEPYLLGAFGQLPGPVLTGRAGRHEGRRRVSRHRQGRLRSRPLQSHRVAWRGMLGAGHGTSVIPTPRAAL